MVLWLSVGLWAENAVVEYNEITLDIEGVVTTHSVGKKLTIPCEKKVCMTKGDGALVISKSSGEKIELMLVGKKSDCITLKASDCLTKTTELSMWSQVKGYFKRDSTEKPVTGVNRKDFDKNDSILSTKEPKEQK